MTLFKVPLCPHWTIPNCCVSTPDGGILYLGSKTVNYISMIKNNASPVIKIFYVRQYCTALDVDPEWTKTKYFAILASDNSVQIWDWNYQNSAIYGHKVHTEKQRQCEGNGPNKGNILLSYMCNRSVLTIDSTWNAVVYCVASNTYFRYPLQVPSKHRLSYLKCSPFDENIFAAGTLGGLVMIVNLKTKQIVHYLRGHDNLPISSLSWCMIRHDDDEREEGTTNVDPPIISALNDSEKIDDTTTQNPAVDDPFNIYDFDYLQNEFGTPFEDNKSRENGDICVMEKAQEENEKFDFVEACQSLKEDIEALKANEMMDSLDNSENATSNETMTNQVTLLDCQQVKNDKALSSTCPSCNKSSSSDDDAIVAVNGEKIIHKAEVYAAENASDISEEISVVGVDNLCNEKNVGRSTSFKETVLLASAGSDNVVWIWNTETGSACDQIKLRGNNNKNRNYLDWLDSKSLIVNDKSGEIKSWSLNITSIAGGLSNKTYKFKADTKKYPQHSVTAFSLCPISRTLWAITSFREISCHDIDEGKIIAKYSCAANTTFSMRECPDDMNKIALGLGDRRIGIIDISNASPTNVFIESYASKIDSVPRSLAWNSTNRLAFGTEEGRVGIINTEKGAKNAVPFLFNQFCGKPIYSMDFNGNYIYVVANGTLALYEGNMKNKDPFILESIVKVSYVSVKGTYLFVGTQLGHLEIYRILDESAKSYELKQKIEISSYYIKEINWSTINPRCFAVIANSNRLEVFDFDSKEAVAKSIRQITLKNPKTMFSSVKWSNQNKNLFVTSSNDGAIRVWDLNSIKDEEKFLKQYNCPMMYALFLPTDENIIMCVGLSSSIELFDMRKEATECYSTAKLLQRDVSKAPNPLSNVKWATKAIIETKMTAADKRKLKKKMKNESILDNTTNAAGEVLLKAIDTPAASGESTVDNKDTNNAENAVVTSMFDEMKIHDEIKKSEDNNQGSNTTSIYLKHQSSLLYLVQRDINRGQLEKITLLLNHYNQNNFQWMDNAIYCVKLFGTKSDALKLLDEEYRNQQSSGVTSIANLMFPQIRSNLKDEILKCIQTKQLNEWHVSLAPSISYSFWKKTSQAFAEQLLEQGYVIQAATYFLGIHKVIETVHLLLEKNYFKEALLIAKVYCQPNDSIFNLVINKWISYQEFTGNFTTAALLCVLSRQPYKGYEILSKMRTDLPEIEIVRDLLKSHA